MTAKGPVKSIVAIAILIVLSAIAASSANAQQHERVSAKTYNRLVYEFKHTWNIYTKLLSAYNYAVIRHNSLLAKKNALAKDIIPMEKQYRLRKVEHSMDASVISIIPYIEGCFFPIRTLLTKPNNIDKTVRSSVEAYLYHRLSVMDDKVTDEYEKMARELKEMKGNLAQFQKDIESYIKLKAVMKAHFAAQKAAAK